MSNWQTALLLWWGMKNDCFMRQFITDSLPKHDRFYAEELEKWGEESEFMVGWGNKQMLHQGQLLVIRHS